MSDRSAVISIVWACLSSWYYGYHLSELNFPVASLTCLSPAFPTPSRLPLCLNLDASLYGLITAIFTIGGLIGSLSSSWMVEKEGLKGGLAWTGYLNLIGVLGMGIAPHWVVLAGGRFITGVSSGIAVCLVPPFLSQVARSSPELASKSGQIGTMNQLAIVLGICSAQIAGLLLTGERGDIPGSWRYVVAISGLVAAVQVATTNQIVSPFVDAPNEAIFTAPEEGDEEAEVEVGLESPTIRRADEAASPLLPDTASKDSANTQLSLRSVLSNSSLRGPALLCASIMALQQFSGVNAVMFYSTPVLRPLLPTSAGLVGVGITVVNAIMTLPAIFLMDRLGRKTLILASIGGMAVTSALLAIGLNEGHQSLSAVSIIAFIASFSIGLGPVPFLLISELVPSPAVPALSSLSLSTNWISNCFIAIFFLPIRNLLSTPVDRNDPDSDRRGEGRVFYLFTGVLILGGIVVSRGLKSGR
ncbi:hypothetical protein CI109_102818 [Kwoniella shandongensis]|uniref:Uncharacterized protein n=1 Tax=Kwoniella shandongensis TaxID=1734106 RepID=A0A5M6C8E4_9TREE|nr:uncharacterized protein CI109_000009 [Kwoniella shandongensis]KAA5531171.1 hypothetical protein CI109_000009 [Kwoniella shandongensis]